MAGQIYVASVSGTIQLADGSQVQIHADVTRVREGHPLLVGRESMFRKIDVHYDVETARQAPAPEAKPVAAVAEAQTAVGAGEAAAPKAVGLTSDDAPGARTPQRGRRRVTKTEE